MDLDFSLNDHWFAYSRGYRDATRGNEYFNAYDPWGHQYKDNIAYRKGWDYAVTSGANK